MLGHGIYGVKSGVYTRTAYVDSKVSTYFFWAAVSKKHRLYEVSGCGPVRVNNCDVADDW